MKKTVALLLIFCLIASLLGGCALFDDGTGKTLYYPVYSDTASFDPQIAADEASRIIAENCFEGLVKYDAEGKIAPGVASSWDISSDGLVYTFHLDHEAKWHIGDDALEVLKAYSSGDFNKSVLAEDFVFGLRRYFDPETHAQADSRLYLIENASDVVTGSKTPGELGINAVDTHTLEIRLESPSDTFLSALMTGATMPCREEFFLATKGRYGLSTEYIICNGAFYLSAHSDGSYIQMSKNDDYKNAGSVLPKSVFLYVNSSEDSRLNKLETGVYDVCPVNVEGKMKIKEKGISFESYLNSVWAFCFNCAGEVFSSVEMRGAVCRSIDASDLPVPDYAAGYSNGFVPDICMIGDRTYRSLSGEAAGLKYEPEISRDMFEQGLKKLGKGSAEITLLCPEDLEDGMRKLVQNWQKNLGMSLKIKIEPLTVEEIDARIAADDFDVAFSCISTPYASAADFLASFTQSGDYRIFNYTSLNFDDAVKEASYAYNASDMAQKCKNAEEIILQNGVVYPVFDEESYLALGENVSGVYLTQAGTIPVFSGGKRVD
ncbi:MAG: peptide ABC transporter substrate-binding protein [Clostridia bacterium]|nr:peptide ABC transporter substrate-binding protein [Clostridia bacterium]